MSQGASDERAVENAYRAIDRYIAEVSGPREESAEAPQSSEGPPLSLSQRLQVLGERHVGTLTPQEAAPPPGTMATPLPPNEF